VALITNTGLPAIFTEAEDASGLTQAVADEVGRDVDVVPLDVGSLGAPGSETDSLLGLLRSAATTIVDALS
jgi:ABC-type Zn uptake system ZnuABC Zn-binding protein ZnuA